MPDPGRVRPPGKLPKKDVGTSCSSGPRASSSLGFMSELEARGPEEHEKIIILNSHICNSILNLETHCVTFDGLYTYMC